MTGRKQPVGRPVAAIEGRHSSEETIKLMDRQKKPVDGTIYNGSFKRKRTRKVRVANEEFDPYLVYDTADFFSIRMHHGGYLTPGHREYIGGRVDYVDKIKASAFCFGELDLMLKELGHPHSTTILFYYVNPTDLSGKFGQSLRPFWTRADATEFVGYVERFKILDVYYKECGVNQNPRVQRENGSSDDKVVKKQSKSMEKMMRGVNEGPSLLKWSASGNGMHQFSGREMPEITNVDEIAGCAIKTTCPPKVDKLDSATDGRANDGVERNEHDCYVPPMESPKRTTLGLPIFGDFVHDDQFDQFLSNWTGHLDHTNSEEKLNTGVDGEENVNIHAGPEYEDLCLSDLENEKVGGELENFLMEEDEPNQTGVSDMVEHDISEDNVNARIHDKANDQDHEYKCVEYQTTSNVPKFEVGMRFGTKKEFARAIRTYSVGTSRKVKLTHNDNTRMRAACEKPCKWSVHCRRVEAIGGVDFVVTATNLNHSTSCTEDWENKQLTADWLSSRYLEKFRANIKMPLQQVRQNVDEDFHCEISRTKAYNARAMAQKKILGSDEEQYRDIWRYVAELNRTHPGSTIDVEFMPLREEEKNPRFLRVYCCLEPLKTGFKKYCRPIIGVDGCFTTGTFRGQILAAMGCDGNNGYWPVAWAVVEKEAREQWIWFLEHLVADLNLHDSHGFTVISDQQKGLKKAIELVMPNAEHRYCVQHIYNCFKKKHAGTELRNMLWSIASASTPEHFEVRMKSLKEFDLSAFSWIKKKAPHPESWVKAFFPEYVKCDTLVNNLCESFNSKILDAREQPFRTQMETIRVYFMTRIARRGGVVRNFNYPITPVVKDILSERARLSRLWKPLSNGKGGYEVKGPGDEQFVVYVGDRTCSCRIWQLSGIPCCHAMPCICRNKMDPVDLVDSFYKKDTFCNLYSHVINPINGRSMWPQSSRIPLDPPLVFVQPGRPLKKRKEVAPKKKFDDGTVRLRRNIIIHCGICNQIGHNQRTCKNGPPVATNQQEKTSQESTTIGDETKGPKQKAGWNNKKKKLENRSSYSVQAPQTRPATRYYTQNANAIAENPTSPVQATSPSAKRARPKKIVRWVASKRRAQL